MASARHFGRITRAGWGDLPHFGRDRRRPVPKNPPHGQPFVIYSYSRSRRAAEQFEPHPLEMKRTYLIPSRAVQPLYIVTQSPLAPGTQTTR